MMGQAQILAFSTGSFHFYICPVRIVPTHETNYWMANGSMSNVFGCILAKTRQAKAGIPQNILFCWRFRPMFICLAVSYFHTGRPRTIIGAKRFHFWVRNGFRWYPLAMAARQTGWWATFVTHQICSSDITKLHIPLINLLGCYMIKPHGQLVRVSLMHYCTSTPRLSTS